MIKVKRALISVSDKSGIVDFARGLNKLGIEIISTGGTAKMIKEAGIPVKEVSEYTGFPEMLDGRVKTLHPKIHAGLLALRENPEHLAQLKEHNIGLIDMAVINLYPFEKVIQKKDVKLEEAIENIDIGGPSMLRSSAKNFKGVAVICNPARYKDILTELENNNGIISDSILINLAIEVFNSTSRYDSVIYDFLSNKLKAKEISALPKDLILRFTKLQDLRYGENPHQMAAFYTQKDNGFGLAKAKQLHGKELSFNNILDLNAAFELIREFSNPAVVFIKHNNPCGVAEDKDIIKAYKNAWDSDKLSAFGGIVGINRAVDKNLAKEISKSGFLECIIAPSFKEEALEILKQKKNIRLLEMPFETSHKEEFDLKKVFGGLLLQDKDTKQISESDLKTVTNKKPTKAQIASLLFAWKVVKHTKSNAIVLAKGTKTVGIGPGQTSRVESVIIAIRKAGKNAKGSILASDAFFPKEDAVKLAIKAGISAIIQPGGSISDEEIIKVCNKSRVPMITTGVRHFKH
ncbi:MAG: bifunctional phosphoribosylaminoimidazolecarboxamide formyltransferase/IMP cyclohydrolase [Candidatus Omnitrophota bacterium]|nr:bifunctional phosphoribosylaminoimidazolecarboxamide formyltransferase/IMP cyclohydrolase [Candidatus Omnitrophota bacterium]